MVKKCKQKKDDALSKKCIKKFFFKQYKYIAQAGGAEMQSLGLEASLEACEALFKDGDLILKAFDENCFYVFLKRNKNAFEVLYDSTKEYV